MPLLIFSFFVNPNISQMLENAQHVGTVPSTFAHKEVKKKPSATKASKAMSQDMTQLSDDMLGSMDPDDYQGGGGGSDLQKRLMEMRWEEEEISPEELEDRRARERDEKERKKLMEQRMRDGLIRRRDDKGRIDFGDEKPREERKKKRDGETHEENKESQSEQFQREKENPRDGRDEDDSLHREKTTGEKEGGLTKNKKPDISMEEYEQDESLKDRKDSLYKDTPQEISYEKGKKDNLGDEGPSAVSISQEARNQEAGLTDDPSRLVSFMGFDDGYIIADTSKKKIPPPQIGEKPDEIPRGKEEEPKKVLPPSLEARFNKVFNKMITGEKSGEAYDKVCEFLRRFGVGVLEKCLEQNERVLILSGDKDLSHYPAIFTVNYPASVKALRRGFFPIERIVVLGEEVIIKHNPLLNEVVFFFSYAFDHALGSGDFASKKSPLVSANFQLCEKKEPGHHFIDSLSTVSPVHYFAQCCEIFLSESHGKLISQNPHRGLRICTKEQLYDMDRPMYMYLEYLFKQTNKKGMTKEEMTLI